MPSQSEIERHKLLRREAENSARAEEAARMPITKQQLKGLFDHLDGALIEGCDHTLRFTETYLRSQGLFEVTIFPWLKEYGGYCDCEVLANVEEHWGES